MSFEDLGPQHKGRDAGERLPQKSETTERRRYKLESGITVDVLARDFMPETERRQSEAVVFLPGWSMTASDDGIEELCRAYASLDGARAIAVSSRSLEQGFVMTPAGSDFLNEEARAIARYLQERSLRAVKLVGHSQGVVKAIDLAGALARGGVRVNGVIMLNGAGLQDQGYFGIASLGAHVLGGTPGATAEMLERRERAVANIGINSIADATTPGYPLRLQQEIEEVSSKTARGAQITAPIVVFMGVDDPIAQPGRVTPEALRELFPNAAAIRTIVSEETGDHLAPFEQPRTIARETLGELDRLEGSSTVH